MSVTAAQIDTALKGVAGPVAYSFRLDVLDANEVRLSDVTTSVTAASIQVDITRDVVGSASFTLAVDGLVDSLANRLKPWMRLLVAGEIVEFPLGVYLPKKPQRTSNAREVQPAYACYDKGVILQQNLLTTPYTASAGDNYISDVSSIAVTAGIPAAQQALTATSSTLPTAKTWDIGVSRLKVCNDLLDMINYQHVWFDANGIMRTNPIRLLSQTAPAVTYQTDVASMIVPDVQDDWDDSQTANCIVVVCKDPSRAAFSATYTNSNPASRASTVTLGRTITRKIDQNGLNSVTEAQALAQQQCELAAAGLHRVTLQTSLDPRRQPYEAYDIEVTSVGSIVLTGKYWCTGWTMDLKTGGLMKHTLSRVEPI